MNRRRHLGTVYETYPAMELENLVVWVTFKVFMVLLASAIWTGVYLVGVMIYAFLDENLLGNPKMTTLELFHCTTPQWIYWISLIVVAILVIRSRVGSRKKQETDRRADRKGAYELNNEEV